MRRRQLFLNVGDCLARIQVFGANLGAIHNCVASVQLEGIIQFFQSLLSRTITRIFNPTIGLHQHGRSQILVRIPPVTWAGSRAAGTQDTFVHAIQLGPIFFSLQILGLSLDLGVRLQPGFNGTILFIKVPHVRDQVLENVHVGQGINLGRLGCIIINVTETCQGVGPINIHGTGTTNSFPAGSTKCQGRVLFILNLDESIQDHWTAIVQINWVGTEIGPLRLFRIPSVDLEILDFLLLIGRNRGGRGGLERCFGGQTAGSKGGLKRRVYVCVYLYVF